MRGMTLLAATALIGGCADTGPSPAQIDAAIGARQAAMAEMQAAMVAIGGQITGGAPEMAVVGAQARLLRDHARQITGLFPAGTGPVSGRATLVNDQVWADPAGFARHAAALDTAAAALEAFSERGDPRHLMQRAMAVDATCVACHKAYRVE
jgi:cytochrome c556